MTRRKQKVEPPPAAPRVPPKPFQFSEDKLDEIAGIFVRTFRDEIVAWLRRRGLITGPELRVPEKKEAGHG